MIPATRDSTVYRWAGLAAIAGALLGVAGDLLLQFSTDSSVLLSKKSLYFVGVPSWRLYTGHYLGVAGIVLEIAGFWQVYWALRPAGHRWAVPFAILAGGGAAVGAAFHATAVFVGLTVQAQVTSPEATLVLANLLFRFEAARVGLVLAAALGLVTSSLVYAAAVGWKRTDLPRWMAWINPLTLVAALGALGVAVPGLLPFVAPAALNLAHLGFFVATTMVLWPRSDGSASTFLRS